MATTAARPGGAAGDGDLSSSGSSDLEEDEIATISDVFADMVETNEDLLLAAATYQLSNDVPSILAYQRILHRNLIEMADFVDSIFGVYHKPAGLAEESEEKGDSTKDAEVSLQAGKDGARGDAFGEVSPHKDVNADTSGEAAEPASEKKRQPERMRSLLIDRFRLENRRRREQRSARLWRKMRRKVKAEESVTVVMTEAAERIAQMTVSAVVAHQSAAEMTSASVSAKLPAASPKRVATSSSSVSSPSEAHEEVQNLKPPEPASAVTQFSLAPPIAQPSSSQPTYQAVNSGMVFHVPPQQQQFSIPLMGSFANPSSAMIKPAGMGSFTKIPLPPMGGSGLSTLFPIAASTLFAPNHMSSVCADCLPLRRTAHECRSILKHITPPPLSTQTLMYNSSPMWPMALNGVMAAFAPPPPVRSVQPLPQAQPTPSSSFKKMCEECKKNHKSVHHCRKLLGHTTPEWYAGADADMKPRKRRTRRQKTADTVAAAANANTLPTNAATTAEEARNGVNET